MFKNKKFTLITIVALVLTLAFGLVAFAPIDAASAATPEDEGFNHGRGPGDFRPGGPGDNEALAEALGISVDELDAAFETVQATALEQAVADGKLTQEQSDQIAERGFIGRRGGFHPMQGNIDTTLAGALGISEEELQAARKRVQADAIQQALEDGKITEEQVAMMEARQALQNYFQKDEMIAKALGITVGELDAAKEDGQHLPDLMEELGIEPEDFEADMQALHEEILQQAIQDGIITQEQADQMLKNDLNSKRGPGGRSRFPGDIEGFERHEGFPGRPGKGEADGTNFQPPNQPTNDG